MIDLRFIRYKVSAGDLPSAESILETHRAEKGEDDEYLLGLAWVARGAALTSDWPAASRYAREAREAARARLGAPPVWENHSEPGMLPTNEGFRTNYLAGLQRNLGLVVVDQLPAVDSRAELLHGARLHLTSFRCGR